MKQCHKMLPNWHHPSIRFKTISAQHLKANCVVKNINFGDQLKGTVEKKEMSMSRAIDECSARLLHCSFKQTARNIHQAKYDTMPFVNFKESVFRLSTTLQRHPTVQQIHPVVQQITDCPVPCRLKHLYEFFATAFIVSSIVSAFLQ